MTLKTVEGDIPEEWVWPNHPTPMSEHLSYWVYAVRQNAPEEPSTERSGKFLLFVKRTDADRLWGLVARATTEGRLGPASKCGTARPNPNSRDPSTTVMCVYTPDGEDHAYNQRVREELRTLGFRAPLSYKFDQQTMDGVYSGDARLKTVRWP